MASTSATGIGGPLISMVPVRLSAQPLSRPSEFGRSERHQRRLDGAAGRGADLHSVDGSAEIGSGVERDPDRDNCSLPSTLNDRTGAPMHRNTRSTQRGRLLTAGASKRLADAQATPRWTSRGTADLVSDEAAHR